MKGVAGDVPDDVSGESPAVVPNGIAGGAKAAVSGRVSEGVSGLTIGIIG
jgi:hypothetical protein